MKIETIGKKFEYEGAQYYIRKIDTLFEYLVLYKGELFTGYFNIKPKWWRRMFLDNPYTDKEEKAALAYTVAAAHTTIETIIKK